MITRKIAREVLERFFTHHNDSYHIDEFIELYPDELTPDEMLAEMRKWAKERGLIFRWKENNHPIESYSDDIICLQTTDCKFINVAKKDRTEAITEAYRQWKEETRGDN